MTPPSANEPQDEPESAAIGHSEAEAERPDERRRPEVAQELEALYKARGPDAYRYLRFLGADPETAWDLLHEAFVKMGKHLCKKQVVDFPSFLIKVVRNTWIDWCRSAEHRRVHVADDLDNEYSDPASEEAFEKVVEDYDQRDEFRAVRAAVLRLSQRQREVVVLHDVIGFSAGQISELVGLTVGAVRYHLSVGRRRLNQLLNLGDLEEEGEDR